MRSLRLKDIENIHRVLTRSEEKQAMRIEAEEISLDAAVELASIKFHIQKERKSRDAIRLSTRRSGAWNLIRDTRWPFAKAGTTVSSRSMAFIVLPRDPEDPAWISFLHRFQRALQSNGFSLGLSKALTGALMEIVDNVREHSESKLPGLTGYLAKPRSVEFAVADLGIGVLESLRSNPRYQYLHTSTEALEVALKPGASRFEGKGRGYGFYTVLRSLAELWGTTRLRSGQGTLILDATSETRKRIRVFLPHLPGLHFAVKCSLPK